MLNYPFSCRKRRLKFLLNSSLTILLLSGHFPAIASSDKADELHQLDVTGVQSELLDHQKKTTILAPAPQSVQGNGHSINNSNITVRSTNTVTGSITSKGGSSVSIGSTTIGSVAEDDENSGISIVRSSPVPEQDPSIPLPNNEVIGQCKNGGEIPSNIDDCWDKCGCSEVDGCSAPVPWKNGIIGYSDIFGEAEACCAEPIDKPCNHHDRCYQSCNTTQRECDRMLLNLMTEACRKLPFSEQLPCFAKASMYSTVLSPPPEGMGFGVKAYWLRQIEFCSN